MPLWQAAETDGQLARTAGSVASEDRKRRGSQTMNTSGSVIGATQPNSLCTLISEFTILRACDRLERCFATDTGVPQDKSAGLVAFVQRLLSRDAVGYGGTGPDCARMADVDLTPMNLELLPPIAHASAEGDPPPHPETFKS